MDFRDRARALEALEFCMPGQLAEELFKVSDDNQSAIAEIGLHALALEGRTQFEDKAKEYSSVWQMANSMLVALESVN